MKKFHFLDGFKIGGIENQAFTLSSLKSSQEENYLVNLDKSINNYPDNFFKQDKFKNLKIISFTRKKGLYLSFLIFKNFKKYNSCKFIIYFNNTNTLWVVLGARISGINNIAVCIQNSVKGISLRIFISIILLRIFNLLNVKLVPCSKSIVEAYLKIDKNLKFCQVIPNCINIKNFQKGINLTKKSEKPDKLKTIIMVARMDRIKDQETLIKAYSEIKDKCKLVLVGNGKNKKKLERLAMELNLDYKKIFLDSRNNISELLANADIFAFSTTAEEGFGIVLIEAMAAGLPIIATDVPACKEVLDNGKAGILVPSKRVDIWTKEITGLLDSKKTRDFYKKKSIQNLKNYDSKNIKLKWENLFL